MLRPLVLAPTVPFPFQRASNRFSAGGLMLRTARIVAALALVALTPLDATARWTQLRSENFLFIGDAPERAIRATAQKLEQFREVMLRAIPGAALTSPVPTVVIVFSSDNSFNPYKPKFQGRTVEAAGWFQRNEDINYIAINAQASDMAFKIIFHEYTHFLVGNWSEAVPVWMGEGLAEVYATFAERDGGKSALLGIPHPDHVGLLQSRPWIPLPELVSIDRSSPTYNEGLRRGVLYAESWALVHYLMLGNDARARQLTTFLNTIRAGGPAEQAFRDAFGNVNALYRELNDYIRKFRIPVIRVHLGEKIGGGRAARGEPIPDALAAAYLGDVLARLGRPDDARAHLRSLLDKNPDVGRAACALGLIELRANRYDVAMPLLERAAALAPDDPWVQTALGRALIAQSEEQRAEAGADALLQRALVALTRAVDRDGTSAHSLATLGRAQLMSGGDLQRASSSLERAVQLTPGREDYRLMLARALILQGEHTRAAAQLGPLVARGSRPQIRDSARTMLADMARRAQTVEAAALPDVAERPRLGIPVAAAGSDSAPGASRRSEAQPLLRPVGPGETRVRGIFRSVECRPQGLVLSIDRDGRILRLAARRFEDVEFISYRKNSPGGVSCGPQQPALPVLATFRSAEPPGRDVDGQAVAIEVVEDDFVPR
jgi:tetratricopeptide (TPR) repeat protein